MQNQLLEAPNGVLEIANCQCLVVTMGDEDRARAIEIPGVVTLEIRDVSAVVGHDSIEP